MVLSLAALIPSPNADRSRHASADAAQDQAGLDTARTRPDFGAMVEDRKPLPPRAAPQPITNRERDIAPRGRQVSAEAHERNEARAEARRDVDARDDATARHDARDARPDHDEPRPDRQGQSNDRKQERSDAQPNKGQRQVAAKSNECATDTTACATDSPDLAVDSQEAEALAVLAGEAEIDLESEVASPVAQAETLAATENGETITVAITATSQSVTTETTRNAAAIAPVISLTAPAHSGTATSANAEDTAIGGIGSGQGSSAPVVATAVDTAKDGQSAAGDPVNASASSKAAMPLEVPTASLIGTSSDPKAATGPTGAVVDPKAGPVASAPARTNETGTTKVGAQTDAASRPAFAEWMNDFAATQGAFHRSGDLVGSLDRATNGLAGPAAGHDALRPTPLQMLPIEIGMQAVRGVTTFQIRLDPAELGRVDVKLEITEMGEVEASLVVDRVETLALLKRDAQTLQQAFEQAGLKQSDGGLSFSLRGEGQGRDGQTREDRPRWQGPQGEDQLPVQNQIAEIAMRRMMIPNSSIDRII